MKEIRRYVDYLLFVVYIVFVISIFLQGCSAWWVRHSYCSIPFYWQLSKFKTEIAKKSFCIHVEVSCICIVDVFHILLSFVSFEISKCFHSNEKFYNF